MLYFHGPTTRKRQIPVLNVTTECEILQNTHKSGELGLRGGDLAFFANEISQHSYLQSAGCLEMCLIELT